MDNGIPSALFSLLLLCSAALSEPDQQHQQHQQQQLEHFQQYLRIRTAHPHPDYASAADFLTSLATSAGLETLTLEFSPGKPLLLLTCRGSDPTLPSILLNSHIDSVPAEPLKWLHPPFSASNVDGRIFARGSQDDKCLAIQYIEALRVLKSDPSFAPLRTVHVSLVPDEEIGGRDGMGAFANSEAFDALNVGFVLDEGQASPTDEFRVFYADRSPWSLVVRAVGPPGHGARMYDGSAAENLMESVEAIARFREEQRAVVEAGLAAPSELVSVNPVYFKAGTPSETGYVMNVQPSEAEAGFDVRLPPTVDPDLMKRRIAEEWAPHSRNMTYQIIQKGPIRDNAGKPLMTATNESNPWWSVFVQAVTASGGKLSKPEILSSTTDARFMRQREFLLLGFHLWQTLPSYSMIIMSF
ncbi:hypothetical protein QJS10_CPB19g01807 [Acorus calamus]|uniref:N-acyl-aliphatic-L-amino acid amidohydrolase n=1 Tax=Acorus calamus TaxID=4465 RepID=A0AAV9CFQ7_ACOCL|nr:hypothetical protein QJS10_CPB19g01807 [Acorus calamus]